MTQPIPGQTGLARSVDVNIPLFDEDAKSADCMLEGQEYDETGDWYITPRVRETTYPSHISMGHIEGVKVLQTPRDLQELLWMNFISDSVIHSSDSQHTRAIRDASGCDAAYSMMSPFSPQS